MSEFTKLIDWAKPLQGTDYMTVKDLSFDVGRKGSGWTVTVPIGFVFQVSIPKWLRWLLNPHDVRFLKAAAIHDKMLIDKLDRKTSGAVFYDALRAAGVPWLLAHCMWFAVSMTNETK